ncbi:hemerythrin domain-containing protein [Persicimonas caeni]|nr:hemerythrin domain-containing protein [Persicimonas caeni]
MAESNSSDLIEVVHHEHDHLLKLFEDIGDTFEKISSGELDKARREEVLETASDDLKLALEEMLHHFNQEEEVFFVEIEKRRPDLADDIASLASAHELMCDRTRWLHRQLNQSRDTIADRSDEIQKVVKQMRNLLGQHTTNENRLFDSVLENMPPEERELLLAEMRRI